MGSTLRCCAWVFVLPAAILAVDIEARAQFGPGGRYGPGWGAWPGMVAEQSTANVRNLAGAAHRQSRSIAAAQSQRTQQSIQNTLLSQAQQQTRQIQQSTQSFEDLRMATLTQQSRGRAGSLPAGLPVAAPGLPAAGTSAEMASSKLTVSPHARTDLIQWPRVLQDPRFDEDRAKIEAPFRRSQEQGTPIPAAEYQQIIAAATDMKLTLRQLASELRGDILLANEQFLDRLIAEAQERIEQKEKGREGAAAG